MGNIESNEGKFNFFDGFYIKMNLIWKNYS